MAAGRGREGLKLEHQIIRILGSGPKSYVDIRRELGWSIWGEHKALENVLQRLRVAGLIEPGGSRKGIWQLQEGLEVCSSCSGKGVRHI